MHKNEKTKSECSSIISPTFSEWIWL